MKTLYVAIPSKTKTGSEVKGATQSVIARLNSAGMAARRVHSDRGTDFTTKELKEWTQNNGIHLTTTSADDSRANGRAAGGIEIFRRRVRVLLKAAKLDQEYWCYAVGHES